MEIPQEIDNYLKESIDHTLGLPVSTKTLQLKLIAREESLQRIRNQCSFFLTKIKEKDEIIERARAEASMNALAVKRFVEENQRLAEECKRLLSECSKWERECSLYDHDREALMDFGNEADARAKEAEVRVHEIEVQLGEALEELNFYKHQCETRVDSSAEGTSIEENLLESILTTVSKDEIMSGHAFLEANMGHEPCQSLLRMWNSGRLKPSTKKALSLAAEFKTFEKAKEHLRVNLDRAEEEATLLSEQNKTLDAENKRLLRKLQKERNLNGSDGKQTSSASAKTNKRKSNHKMSSPSDKKLDFGMDTGPRQPLSPLRYNSPDSIHKK